MSGFRALLIGPSGAGKTTSIKTLLTNTDLSVFVVSTEPGLLEILGDVKENPRFHYAEVPMAPIDWDDMITLAERINNANAKTLADVSDPNKKKYSQFIDLLHIMSNYVDQRGKEFGGVDSWGVDRVLVLDSLSGINRMVLNLVVGYRPVISQGEWQAAMGQVEEYVTNLCAGIHCHFVVTGHVEREFNEVDGSVQLMISAPGKKLAPKLPRYFSDVIYAVREGTKFYWNTAADNVDLKSRCLPYSEKLTPDFGPLYSNWKKKVL